MVEPVTINLRFLARDLDLPQEQVQAVVTLLDEGYPIPFIARYRKDKTDNLDEDILRAIEEHLTSLRALCERKQAILTKIDSLGQLTPELEKRIRDAKKVRHLEDLYLPFKPKRQSLASEARERGLEPLAIEILEGKLTPENLDTRASEFINEDKKIKSAADALLGAGHIIAEIFSEKIEVIQAVRDWVHRHGKLVTTRIEDATPSAPKKEKSRKNAKRAEKPKSADEPRPAEGVSTEIDAQPPVITTDTANEATETVETVLKATPSETQAVDPTPELESKATEDATPSEEPKNSDPESSGDFSEDSSGSGGGDETVNEVPAEAPVETTTETPAETPAEIPEVGEPVQTVETEAPAVKTSADAEAPAVATSAETASETPVDGDVQAVTEQFQQWKEAQEEKGIPTVTSQNTLRKKKKEEIKKKKAEAKARQRNHFERQFHEYFAFSSSLRSVQPYQTEAINRGEKVKVLKAKIEVDEEEILNTTRELCAPADHPHAGFLLGCLKDALQKRVIPGIDREIRGEQTEAAEKQSIKTVARNLRTLLLQPPLDRKQVLALDPGFRHGCKVVPLGESGNVLDFDTVYLHGNAERRDLAVQRIVEMIRKYRTPIIAIGDGAGRRETEEAISKMISTYFSSDPGDETALDVVYCIVNEAGAGAYSSSSVAKEEFPNYDIMLRGAVSIGRRLQDPLTELVKIEPGNLIVGSYHHDQKSLLLKDSLNKVLESCVNLVGVDLNTATPLMLRYVSGLNALTAGRICEYRSENGPFQKLEDLKKVTGLSESTFTFAAGFLKIHDGENPLDATWIHPENYESATKILEKLGFTVEDLRDAEKRKAITAKIGEEKIGELASRFASELGIGLFTARDILENLEEPDRDFRKNFPKPIFRKSILRMEDLTVGMELTGTVQNVVGFGAFVNIGLPDSGLIHISQMASSYIRDAHDKVSVGDTVRVWVVEADPKKHRISLTMLPPGTEKQPRGERREHRRPRNENRGERSESGERQDRPPHRDDRKKDGPPSGGGGERRDGQRDDRSRRDRNDRRDGGRRDGGRRDNRDRGPRTYVAAPKEKEIKPISEEMKKGKEPMRSFGDLAQLLGRVQVPDPEEEKRKKKEEERRRKEKERQKREQQEKEQATKSETESPAEPADETLTPQEPPKEGGEATSEAPV